MARRSPRMGITVRLPVEEYREVAARAKRRNWSMSDYIGYCVTRELKGANARPRKTHAQMGPMDLAELRDFGDDDDAFE